MKPIMRSRKKLKILEVVEKLKTDNQATSNNDQLVQESMKALNESTDQQERLKKEIKESEKNIKLYETMRSAYDVNKT